MKTTQKTELKVNPKIEHSENEFYNVLSYLSENEIQSLTDKIHEEMTNENEKLTKIHFVIIGKHSEPYLIIKSISYSNNTFFEGIDFNFISLGLVNIHSEYPNFTIGRYGQSSIERIKNYLEKQ